MCYSHLYRPLSVTRLSACDGCHFGRQISIVRNGSRGYLGYFKTHGASKINTSLLEGQCISVMNQGKTISL